MFYKRFLGMSDKSKPNLGFCVRVFADTALRSIKKLDRHIIFKNASRNTLARLIFLVNYPKLLSILPNGVLFSRLFLLFGIKMFFLKPKFLAEHLIFKKIHGRIRKTKSITRSVCKLSTTQYLQKNAKYRQKELTRYDKSATIISKQASRKSALWGEYNKTLTHCCIGFNLCGGAILLL